ncbi:MAG TPA: type II secretion system protein GspC [Polyangia bacterium]|nr:type II secretion system protein GspC [Polyangia bacterium]
METLLSKYLGVVDLIVVALCAIFAARATATVIESSLMNGIPAAKHVARPLAQAAPAVYTKQVEEILKRNIFCSTCPPILAVPVTPGAPVVPDLQRTSLPLKLLAIMFAPPPADPRWSMAIIRDNDAKTAGPYAIGSKLREATVSEIDEVRVYLDFGGGRIEYLELLDRPTPPPGAPAPVAAAPADPFAAELDRGIRKTGAYSYEVQHSTLDALLGNMGALSRAARIVPEMRDGKSIGFRLFSIKPDGPFGKIGLQNGDVISAINGLEMNSPDKALEVYTKLKTANHLSVGLERNGQKITEDYNIR